MTDRQATEDVRVLAPIIGRWSTQGEMIATNDEPSVTITGTDVYTWLADGHFIEHRAHVRMGDDIVEVLEVIGGYDGSSFAMRSFDNSGAFTEMRATADGIGRMSFLGDSIRTTLTVADDGQSMQARWERSEDGTDWVQWMDLSFLRI